MTSPDVVSDVADIDEPWHVLLGEENPHLEAAVAKWRRQVEDDDLVISAFGSSVA